MLGRFKPSIKIYLPVESNQFKINVFKIGSRFKSLSFAQKKKRKASKSCPSGLETAFESENGNITAKNSLKVNLTQGLFFSLEYYRLIFHMNARELYKFHLTHANR